MSDSDLIRNFVERTTRASGVPLRLDDPAVAEQIAAQLRTVDTDTPTAKVA